MDTQILQDPHLNLDHRVDAFEEARRINPRVDLANFLPPSDHPRYLTALAELIRVELDSDWAAGCARPLSEYVLRFPELAENPRTLQEVAFEEYRQRRQAGENATPEEYTSRFAIDAGDWPKVPLMAPDEVREVESDNFPRTSRSDEASVLRGAGVDVLAGIRAAAKVRPDSWVESVSNDAAHQELLKQLEHDRPESAKRWAQVMNSMPEVGCKFLGFRLLEELGRGAFGRVFLAQQADLANRLVALKVGFDIFEESQTLAQLQHTNIVPIYSFHQVGKLQAVCMPYYGSTTLGHVLNHIQSMAGLPRSGKDLVSTLHGRKSATHPHPSAQRSDHPSASGPHEVEVEPAMPVPSADHKPLSETWKLLEGMSFTDAVMWLGMRLVDGLAHAHGHGVLHRDLKPANILLTDDGTPMLLDFNLATTSELRNDATAARIGGTLPYMAPEHLRAFEGARVPPDERSDLYAVGVILFNLLTGRHPFPSYKGKVYDTVKLMLADRLKPAPSLRQWNKSVTPALEAIVQKCLAADPAQRYQKADHLKEDLDRQLRHLPLKHTPEPSLKERVDKFARRHPYLTSTASVCALALAAVLAMAAAWYGIRERVRTLTARNEYSDHLRELRGVQALLDERSPPPSQIERGLEQAQRDLAHFGIATDKESSDWEKRVNVVYLDEPQRRRLREDVGEVFFLMAKGAVLKAERADGDEREQYLGQAEQWNQFAASYSGERLPRSVGEQRAGILKYRGLVAEGKKLLDEMARTNPRSPRDHYLLGHWLVKQGEYVKALEHLRKATREDPEMFSAWFVRGNAHMALGQAEAAAECFCSCIALRPEFAPSWYQRALAYSRLRFNAEALQDCDRAIQLDPSFVLAYIHRADLRQSLGKLKEALADLEHVATLPDCPTQVYFIRANVRKKLGDKKGAAEDFARGVNEEPGDEMSYFTRAVATKDSDPKAALADLNKALKINPVSIPALQEKAHVLSEKLQRHDEAMEVLNRTVELHPDHWPALAGRGVVLARQGKRDEALRDAEAALLRNTMSPCLYQVGCIYALTSKQNDDDRVHALRYLSQALRTGFGLDWVAGDTDLDPVRELPEFKKIVDAARDLEQVRKASR